MALYDEVYGLKYKSAEEQMKLILEAMKNQAGIGFESLEDLEEWAHGHHLDKVMFSNSAHQFMCVSHKGEIMLPTAFETYYRNILFYKQRNGKHIEHVVWHPEGFDYFDKAYIAAERTDGVHRPLFYRDYTVPTGFYNEERDAFNVAKPFPVYAKETGRDTSHIYTYIEHVAGECAMHLLAWLRAKLLHPTVKTQVVPIIVSRTQGSGKSSFAEVICKGLFGKDNVIVSDQYDATARFNADYADALIVCQEEKEETDKRNPAGTLKSRATATTIRKEQKGVDPIYQESFTDFILTTNKDVPVKFEGREDQRRFMVMESDPKFTRKTSSLADEVFTKLYGYDANFKRVCTPFVDDKELIAQFKHELFSRKDIADIELRNFPKTNAYRRCFSLPRTTEATEIESIMRSLAPFIKESLDKKHIVTELEDGAKLTDIVQCEGALEYVPAYKDKSAFVALCRPLVFYDLQSTKPMSHATVERGLLDCAQVLTDMYDIVLAPDSDALPGGFSKVVGRYKTAPTARFSLATEVAPQEFTVAKTPQYNNDYAPKRTGERIRVNSKFVPASNGCFETVNEMKPCIRTIYGNKTANVQYMDTFLLESDTPTKVQATQEYKRAQMLKERHGEGYEVRADVLYKERLSYALTHAQNLFEQGIVARIVYSGAKSYHLLIRVADAPSTIDEYKWLHAYLCNNVCDRLIFDESTCDPARLTRSPITLSRTSTAYGLLVTGEQRLIAENWNNIYDIDWRPMYKQWLGRPLKSYEQRSGKPLMPTRPEYKEALEAILSGEFWTDSKFDGERQHLFFPAYRLLRVLGYSADEAWDDVILPHVDSYKKPNEIGYWRTRRTCALIHKINSEMDDYCETMEDEE